MIKKSLAKAPIPTHQGIKPVKAFLRRFSLVLLLFLTFIIILLGEIEHRLPELARARITDRLLPVMTLMSWPVDYVLNTGNTINELFSLQTENKRLQEENLKLKHYYELAKHLQMEHEALQQLLHVVREPKTSFITAKVIGDASSPYVRSALINAGQANGIKKGQIVINEQGVVGRIIETGERNARILLLTDLNSKIPVITANSRERCIAAGDNTDTVKLLYIREDSQIKTGEQVFTSGDGGMLPSGLLVGTIYAVSDKVFSIKPAVKSSRLGYVQVMDFLQ